MFEQLVLTLGLENIPNLQPKQLPNAGLRELVCVFKGVKIQLVQPEDDYSVMSEMDTSHASLRLGCSKMDPGSES